jgi:hypothetical protein
MGLFGKRTPREISLEGDGDFAVEIVGESYHQRELASLAGKKEAEGKEYYCEAVLICEDNNPHDANAVLIRIKGLPVGHLSRGDAVAYRRILRTSQPDLPNVRVNAVIVGGWRNEHSEGHYGVRLDIG